MGQKPRQPNSQRAGGSAAIPKAPSGGRLITSGERMPGSTGRGTVRDYRRLARGRDIVDPPAVDEKGVPRFEPSDLQVVRAWAKKAPVEPRQVPNVIIEFPRMWNTKRGRYCKFKVPGAGVYGLMRARPTF